MTTDPHPITGAGFTSPVPPGTGWPGDPATGETPVAASSGDVVRLAATAPTLAELDARLSVCRACPRLVDWRESVAVTGRRASFADQPYWGRPVPSFGDERANAVVVGLAPAANGGNRTGRVFTGDKSGDWLFAALHRAGYANQPTATHAGDGLELSGLRILAAVRCAPPENKPTVVERDTCAPWLDRELALLTPTLKVILALGSFGWDSVLRAARHLGWTVPRPKPRFGHGAEVRLDLPAGGCVTLVSCFHVSQHNTFTGRLTEQMLDAVLARVRQLGDGAVDSASTTRLVDDLGRPVPLAGRPQRVVSLVPSLSEAIATTTPGALVGVTDWCTHPPDLQGVRVRGTKNPDLARIRSLAPDLVVANQEENRKLDVERLRAAGVPVWVTRIDSVDEALTSMERLFTEAFDVPVPAWLSRAKGVWGAPPHGPSPRVVVPVWRDPWLVVGSGTYGHDVIERLGWVNLGALVGPRYPQATVEEIIALEPDVVLLPDEPYPFSASDGPEALNPLRCLPFPGRALSWYGPAMVEARAILEALGARAFPDGTDA